jgi:hypothetical protein
MEFIDVNKSELPERFDIDLADETFTLQFNYNETGDFFTVDLYRQNDLSVEEPIVLGEKLTLNIPLWSDYSSLELPAPTIVPLDLAGKERRITFENFGITVFLYLMNEGPDDEQL